MAAVFDPVKLFDELEKPTDSTISTLWDIEKEVIKKYSTELISKERIAIELPTGSGKSVIALLLAEMWRIIGKKVAILCADDSLASILRERGREIGIDCVMIRGKRVARECGDIRTRGEELRKYNRRENVAIMNFWTYLFSDVAGAEILLVDDAHIFENAIRGYYSLSIPNRGDTESLYKEVCRETYRKYPLYPYLEKFYLGEPCSFEDVELIYFNHAAEILDKIKKTLPAIRSRGGDSESRRARFSLERNRDLLPYFSVFINHEEIIFTPYIVPSEIHEKIRNADQIVYISATLGSKETIQKIMGSTKDIHLLTERDMKSEVKTMGRRLIFPLDNTETSYRIRDKTLEIIEKFVKIFPKLLIMCKSFWDAHEIENHLKEGGFKNIIIFRKDEDLQNFKSSKKGVLITAWRFIGLDFPDDECRAAVLVNMPYILNPIDAFVKNVLEDEKFTNEKVAHRLVQAFGRCNRSFNDYAVYYVLDECFVNDLDNKNEINPHFPKLMKAEIEFGYRLSECELEKALDFGRAFIQTGIRSFDEILKSYEKGIRGYAASLEPQPEYLEEIKAWEELLRGNLEAAKIFNRYADSLVKSCNDELEKLVAWNYYLAAFCRYIEWRSAGIERSKREVLTNLSRVAEHGKSPWFGRARIIGKMLEREVPAEPPDLTLEARERIYRRWKSFIDQYETSKNTIDKRFQILKKILCEGKHNQICNALVEIFQLMGYEVEETWKKINEPDLILYPYFAKEKYVVLVEVKSKEKDGKIKITDVNQIGGHIRPYEMKMNCKAYAVIFTNRDEIMPEAEDHAKNKVWIFTKDIFLMLVNKYFDFITKAKDIGQSIEQKYIFLSKIPTPENLVGLLKSDEGVIIQEDEI